MPCDGRPHGDRLVRRQPVDEEDGRVWVHDRERARCGLLEVRVRDPRQAFERDERGASFVRVGRQLAGDEHDAELWRVACQHLPVAVDDQAARRLDLDEARGQAVAVVRRNPRVQPLHRDDTDSNDDEEQ